MVTGDCLGFALCVMLKSMTRQRKRTVHKSIKDEKGASTKSYDKELQLQENVGRSFDQELSSPSQLSTQCQNRVQNARTANITGSPSRLSVATLSLALELP